jgi:hypothetical protein
VLDVEGDHLVQAQRAGHIVDDGQHVDTEGRLELGVLVEVVEHHLGHRITFECDHDAHTDAVRGFVVDGRDSTDFAVLGQLSDRLDEVVRVHLVGQFGDGQDGAPAVVLLHGDHGPHPDRATTGAVGVIDAVTADDESLGREVRTGNDGQQVGEQLLLGSVRVLQCPLHTDADLAQVVRRDVGGHTDGDAGAAVDQQVRVSTGQHRRFLRTAVVVRLEIDSFLVDVTQHLHGQVGQA